MVEKQTLEIGRLNLGVGTIIWKQDKQGRRMFLMGKRTTNPIGFWALPGGSCDSDNVRVAAAREIREESGIDIQSERLKIVSIDDSEISTIRYLDFGCIVQVDNDTDVDLTNASHAHEVAEWRWFYLNGNPEKLSFLSTLDEEIGEHEIFFPCVQTLKCFLGNKLQLKNNKVA